MNDQIADLSCGIALEFKFSLCGAEKEPVRRGSKQRLLRKIRQSQRKPVIAQSNAKTAIEQLVFANIVAQASRPDAGLFATAGPACGGADDEQRRLMLALRPLS